MKFLLIDDHALIREALCSVLRELRSDAVVLEAASCQQGTDLMREHADVSLVLLDLRLPDRDGFDMLAVLRETYPAVGIVMLSAFNDRDNVIRALDQGALGFISKTSSRDVLLGALRLVLAGGVYIPPEILAAPAPSPAGAAPAARPPDSGPPPSPADLGLTERQVDVLALMMLGRSNKLICRALDLAEPTVKNHVSAILKALKVSNRTEAVLAVAALGWKLPSPGK